MRTWLIVFSAVVAAVVLGVAAVLMLRSSSGSWEREATAHNRRLIDLADKLTTARGAPQGYAASELLLEVRAARKHLDHPAWLADAQPLRFGVAQSVLAIDEYRKAGGLPPLSVDDY